MGKVKRGDRILGDNGYGAMPGGKKFSPDSQRSMSGPPIPYLVMKESNHDRRIEALEVMIERLQAQLNIMVDSGIEGLQAHAADVKARTPTET